MSQRTIHILGTSAQVPTRTRNQGGYFLKWDEHGFLFDPGEGTQRRLIYHNISSSSITKIFITHFHGDHCLGLAGIIQRISVDQVQHEIEVYFPEYGAEYYDNLRHSTLFHDMARIVPKPFSSAGIIFQNNKLSISCQPLDHNVETWGFRIVEKDSRTLLPAKLSKTGIDRNSIKSLLTSETVDIDDRHVRIEEVSRLKPGQRFAFIMDTRYCQSAIDLAQDADIMVCESTYLSADAALADEYGHLTAAQAAEIARQAGVKMLVLTHYSQRYLSSEAFADEASKLHPNVVAANDGDVIKFPPNPRNIDV